MTTLTKRLECIYELIPKETKRLVDVGCDHGFLSKKFLENTEATKALLIDNKEKPLNKAKQNLENIETSRLEFSLSDGLLDWQQEAADTVVIAGLGAKTIIGILEDKYKSIKANKAFPEYKEDFNLLIQSMRHQEIVRYFMRINDFELLEQDLVSDNNFIYSVDLYSFNFSKLKHLSSMHDTNNLEDFLGSILLNKLESKSELNKLAEVKEYLYRQSNVAKIEMPGLAKEKQEARKEVIKKLDSLREKLK